MIIDLIVIGILLIFAIVGFKKGFLPMLVGVLGILAALVASVLLTAPIVKALDGSAIHLFVDGKATEWLAGIDFLSTTTIPSEEALITALSEKLPAFIATMLAGVISPLIGTAGDKTLAELLTPTFSNLLMNVLVFLALFVLALIIFAILKGLAKSLHDAPLVGSIDKVLGLVLGAALGLIFVYVVLYVFTFFASNESFASVIDMISASSLTKYLYNNNLIGIILGSAFQGASVATPSPSPIT